jgi:hypothetical protein
MSIKKLSSYRLYLTGLITIITWALLTWSHFNGGVTSHHLLHRDDLPAISNWWGALLLPLLSWFLLYRAQKRILSTNDEKPVNAKLLLVTAAALVTALFYGALIALAFLYNFESIPGYLMLGILLIALFYPVYRAECVLGFVIGMSLAFGVFIPTVVAGIFALLGFLIYRFIRPALRFLISTFSYRKSSK